MGEHRMINMGEGRWRWLNLLILVSGATGVALALLILVGWCTGTISLLQVLPTSTPMQFSTALAFLLCGLGLLSHLDRRTYLAAACGVAVSLIGLLTLGQYLFGFDLGIDELLIDGYVTGKTTHPGRMAPNTALLLLFSGISLAFLNRFLKTETSTKQRLARIVEDSINEVYVFDAATFKFMEMNASAIKNLGYTLEELKELTPLDLIPEYSREDLEALVHPLRSGEQDYIRFETVHRRKDGSEYDVGVLLQQIRSDDRLLFVAIIEDITDRKKADAELARHRDQLQELVDDATAELKDKAQKLKAANDDHLAFTYSVSHDLRAPLRSIDGFSQAIAEDYGDELDADGQDFIRRIRAGCQQMEELIDGMLKLSRLSRNEWERREIDLSAIAQDVATQIQELNPARQVTLEIAPKLTAFADSQQIRILLDNLLRNAWKYSSNQEHARIQFGQETEGGEAVFFLRDNGVGFDMAYANKLFKPFQRLHSDSEFEGSGIGLATVARIVRRHGGRIWAESSPGHGATFYFTLSAESKQEAA